MRTRTYIIAVATVWYLFMQVQLIDAPGFCWVQLYEYGWPFRTVVLTQRPANSEMPILVMPGNYRLGANILWWGILGNALVYLASLLLIRVVPRTRSLSKSTAITGIGSLCAIVVLDSLLYVYGPRTETGMPLYLWGLPMRLDHYDSVPFLHPLIVNSLLMLSIPFVAAYLFTRGQQCDEPNGASPRRLS